MRLGHDEMVFWSNIHALCKRMYIRLYFDGIRANRQRYAAMIARKGALRRERMKDEAFAAHCKAKKASWYQRYVALREEANPRIGITDEEKLFWQKILRLKTKIYNHLYFRTVLSKRRNGKAK